MTQLKTQPRIKTYVPKAPAQRAYMSKASDPGQCITWTRSIGYTSTEARTGTIWSAGALPSSVWVQPDDAKPGDMALVMLRSMTEHPSYPASWQHDTIKRCEYLRQSRGMVAEYRTEKRRDYRDYYGPEREHESVIAFHSDPQCCEIQHDTRPVRPDYEPTTGYVIRMLLDASARGRSDLCRRCVYLSEPAEVTDAA
jgi:hypothetical protein